MSNDFNSMRVGVDWSNKGVVCMGSSSDDPHNLIPDSIFYQSHPTVYSISGGSGTLEKTYHPAGDYPVAGAIRWIWNASSGDRIWFFWDGLSNMSLDCDPSTAYTMYMSFLKPDLVSWSGTVRIFAWNGSSWDELANSNLGTPDTIRPAYSGAVNPHQQQQQITFTTGASHSKLGVRFDSLSWSPSLPTIRPIQINGFMLVEGTYENAANSGTQLVWNCYTDDPLSVYDDVSHDLISVDYQLGKTQWDQALPSEGTATIVLKNAHKMYSPEAAEFIGGFITNRRVIIEQAVNVKAGGFFGAKTKFIPNLAWSGWVKSLNPTPKTTADRTATLEAEQGWYNLEKTRVSPKILTDITTGEAMFQALSNGYELPTNPAFARIDFGMIDNTWIIDPAVLIPNYESGITLDFSGMYWQDNATATEILEDLIDFENNWLWMDRYGAIHFREASDITGTAHEVSVDQTDIQSMEYQYGDEIWTGLNANVVYQTLVAASPPNLFALSDIVTVDIDANTAINLEIPHTYNEDNSVNDKSYGTHGDQVATAVRLDDLSSSVTIGGPGNSVLLGFIGQNYDDRNSTYGYSVTYSVYNTNAFPVRVNIQTLGYAWRIDFEGKVSRNDDTLSFRYGYKERTLTNQYLQTETLTNDYFDRKILRYSTVYGWFPSIKIIPIDASSAALSNQLKVGTIWRLETEDQTGVEDKDMVIIGESVRATPQLLEKIVYSSPRF